jgi:hypothetical protein
MEAVVCCGGAERGQQRWRGSVRPESSLSKDGWSRNRSIILSHSGLWVLAAQGAAMDAILAVPRQRPEGCHCI